MDNYHKYPKVYSLGTKETEGMLSGGCWVQEKLDGSQISFGVDMSGELHAYSRGGKIDLNTPQKLFAPAIAHLKTKQEYMIPGYVYRGECISSPRHNRITYDRMPKGFVVLWDVCNDYGAYIPPSMISRYADAIGVETANHYGYGVWDVGGLEEILFSCQSQLGGMIEGVVLKSYDEEGPPRTAKFVSEKFKEVVNVRPKVYGLDLSEIGSWYGTESRWLKAIQHLLESGELTDSPADIGPIIKEVHRDLLEECEREMKELVWAQAWPELRKHLVKGLAEWYKRLLFERYTPAA